jgi:hypothetical protein
MGKLSTNTFSQELYRDELIKQLEYENMLLKQLEIDPFVNNKDYHIKRIKDRITIINEELEQNNLKEKENIYSSTPPSYMMTFDYKEFVYDNVDNYLEQIEVPSNNLRKTMISNNTNLESK